MRDTSCLVSGASSGLGAYLAAALEADTFDRAISAVRLRQDSGETGHAVSSTYDVIVHAAFNMPDKGEAEADYIARHVKIASELLNISHRRFVFISSIDAAVGEPNAYGKAKLAVEALVRERGRGVLIVRPGALLGRGMRISQLIKVARGDAVPLSLSADSTFSLVFYEDVLAAVTSKAEGTFPLLAPRLVTLSEVAARFGRTPVWGGFAYVTAAGDGVSAWPESELATVEPLERLEAFVAAEGWK